MARSNGAWGIEIGASGLKAIRLERKPEGIAVTDFTVLRHSKILTTPGLDVPAMVRNTLVQFVQAYAVQLKSDTVAVSVPGNQALARFVTLPPVDKKRIPEMVRYEAEQQIPFPIDEVEWDSQVFGGADGLDVRVGIFAITKDRLRETLELYAECGLNPSIVTLSPVAYYNAFVYDVQGGKADGTVTLIDVGSSSTDFIAAQDGTCYLRTFPVGGHQFTEAVAAGFRCAYPKAEAAKLAGATGKYAREVIRAMAGAYEQFIDELRRSIEHYQTINPNAHVRSVVGVGGTLRLTGLRKFVGGQIQVEIARWDEFKRIRVDGKEGPDFAANTVNLATAYGLALQSLGETAIDINLLPAEIMRRSMWKSKVPYFAAAAVLGVVTGAAMFLAPFVEASALGSGAVPASVSMAENEAKAKSAEVQAQVDRVASNGSAAPFMALLDDREVWPWIISDAYAALGAANPQAALLGSDVEAIRRIKAKDRSLVILEDLRGAYQFDKAKGTRDIVVTMQVGLTKDDGERFLNTTVVEWLRTNAKRDDAPYEILIDEDKTVGSLANRAKSGSSGDFGQGATAGGTGAGFGAGAATPPPGGGFGISGNGGGGGGEGGASGGGSFQGRRNTDAGTVDSGKAPGGLAGSGAGGGGNSGGGAMGRRDPSNPASTGTAGAGSTTANAEAKSIDDLAPLPARPNLLEASDADFMTTITFTVRLKGGVAPVAPEAGTEQ